ncbi:MAG: hypothetical protein Q4C36_00745 [Coriobacteriia bacterium]|nr:hypothetical protein [Coriobacteriia bacterium]
MKKAAIALGCLGGLAAGAVYAAPQIKERLLPDIGQQTAVIVNMHDSNMLSVDKVYMHEDQIAMDGSILGAMPGTFYIKPAELYKMVSMVDLDTVKGVVSALIEGRKQVLSSLQK